MSRRARPHRDGPRDGAWTIADLAAAAPGDVLDRASWERVLRRLMNRTVREAWAAGVAGFPARLRLAAAAAIAVVEAAALEKPAARRRAPAAPPRTLPHNVVRFRPRLRRRGRHGGRGDGGAAA